MYINGFQLLFGKWVVLAPKMMHGHNSGSTIKNSKNLLNQRGQEVHQNHGNGFSEKTLS